MGRAIEAFAVYHGQKESLAEDLQIASAGLFLLRRNVDVSNGPSLLGALVDACGVKHWAMGKQYKKATERVDRSLDALANQGIIQQVSAFDIFTRSFVEDLARFSTRARLNHHLLAHHHELVQRSPAGRWVSSSCCNDIAGRLDTLSKRLAELGAWTGWAPSKRLKPILPLFDLVRSIRNRIAHNDGLVGSKLEEFAASKEIADALKAFRKNYARRDFPSLPDLTRGTRLKFQTVHAIFFGAVLYEIAKELNSYAVSLLDDGEFIDMAFYYSCVLEEHPFRTARHRSAETRIGYFLGTRFLREHKKYGLNEIISRLSKQKVADARGVKLETSLWRVAVERHADLVAEN